MRLAAAGLFPGMLHHTILTHLHSDHTTDFNDVLTTWWVMPFTAGRPLPSGRLNNLQAATFGAITLSLGVAELAVFVNLLTALLGGLRRGDPTRTLRLASGDALVLGFLGGARAFGVIDLSVHQGTMLGLDASCRFDGIPLALELAAARLRARS